MSAPRTTIARLRWHRGLTQKELAKLSRLSIKTIEKVEAGRTKGSPRTALLLAGALAADVEDIVAALLGDYVGTDQATEQEQREMMDAVMGQRSKLLKNARTHATKLNPTTLPTIGNLGADGEQDGVEVSDIAAGA